MAIFDASKQTHRSRIRWGLGLAVGLAVGVAIAPPTLAQTPAAMPLPSAAGQTDQGYILGAGDRLRVDLFNIPEYSGEVQVLADGTLNLPIVGSVSVRGLTIVQASQLIATRYLTVVRRPIVTITMLATRPLTVAIAGEIANPGTYSLTSNTGAANNSSTTLTAVLRQAGGVSRAADLGRVQIRRLRSLAQGEPQVLTVNLWQLVRQGDLQQDIVLRDGDSVFIPTATTISLDDARLLGNSTFVEEGKPIQVAIVGEVNRPGPHTIEVVQAQAGSQSQAPTVTQAIQAAGGITQAADIRNIEVRRVTQSGAIQAVKVNFWELLQAGDLRQDLPLQAGDTVVIPTATTLTPEEITRLASASFSPTEMTVNVVGEVKSPGAIVLPPNAPLNQAILAAGGFNNRARSGSVILIRLNPDGTVARRRIDVDFASGVGGSENPPLSPNDTVLVGRSGLTEVTDLLGTLLSPVTSIIRLIGL